jgi:hypothetical protein
MGASKKEASKTTRFLAPIDCSKIAVLLFHSSTSIKAGSKEAFFMKEGYVYCIDKNKAFLFLKGSPLRPFLFSTKEYST